MRTGLRVVLLLALGLVLVACTSLSTEQERRLLELSHTMTTRQLSPEELAEWRGLMEQRRRGEFDLGGALYAVLSVVAALWGTRLMRGPAKPMDPVEVSTLRRIAAVEAVRHPPAADSAPH